MTRSTQTGASQSQAIGLQDVLTFLRRGWIMGLFVAILSGGTAYYLTSNAEPVYRASIALIMSQTRSGLGTLDVVTPPQVDPSVYRSALFEGTVISDALMRVTGTRPSEQALTQFLNTVRVTVDSHQLSSVIRVEVDHTDPAYAADIANTIADELMVWDRSRARSILARGATIIERAIADIDTELASDVGAERRAALLALRQQRVQELERATAVNSSALVVGLLEPLRFATPPELPVGPRVVFLSFVATVLGLIAGFGLVLLRDVLDTTVRDRDSVIALTGLPVIAEFGRRRRRERRLSGETASFLRTNLAVATRGSSPRIFVITSIVDTAERDGVAVALAESFARGGSRTLLVDADLRHPATSDWLDVVPSHAAPFEVYLANPGRRYLPVSVAVGSKQTFDFVPSFTSARYPVDILNQGLPYQLDEWKAAYDVIILDSTPVVPFADTLAIAPFATGVILCASVGTSRRGQLAEAVGLLERGEANVLGIVLTNLPSSRTRQRHLRADVPALERQAVDPYKTSVPTTRHPIDTARG